MGGMFISKKTKATIRARRKKNLSNTKKSRSTAKLTNDNENENENDNNTPTNTGTGTSSTQDAIMTTPDKAHDDDHRVTVPTGLTGKELKKFRKDARRTFRARNPDADEALLQFLNEGTTTTTTNGQPANNTNQIDDPTPTPDETPDPPTKKRRRIRVFPRINDILAEAEDAQRAAKQQAKKDSYEKSIPPSERARYVALDCEMVGIGASGQQSALARVSVTDWAGGVLLDTFVRVPDRVTDFRTFVSGVRAKDIGAKGGAMELHACRGEVAGLMKGKVLVGHSLKNDFAALMLNHPKRDVRDTARYKPFMRASGRGGGKLRPRKLRDLAKEHLELEIQREGEEHSSVDDAKATMELYKFVREKWEKEAEAIVTDSLRHSGKRKR